jgi:hypothetical protein
MVGEERGRPDSSARRLAMIDIQAVTLGQQDKLRDDALWRVKCRLRALLEKPS